jgi:hypothetical protein
VPITNSIAGIAIDIFQNITTIRRFYRRPASSRE